MKRRSIKNKEEMFLTLFFVQHLRQQGQLFEAEKEIPSIEQIFSLWDESYKTNTQNGLHIALSFFEEMIQLGTPLPTEILASKLCHSLFTKSIVAANRERIFEILRQVHGNRPEVVSCFITLLRKAQSSRSNSRLVAISSIHFMTYIINHTSKRINLQEFFELPNNNNIKEIMERILFQDYPVNYHLSPFEKSLRDSFRSRDSEVILVLVELLGSWSFRSPEMMKFFLVYFSEINPRPSVKLACLKVIVDMCFISQTCFEEEGILSWRIGGKEVKDFLFHAMRAYEFEMSGIAIFGIGRMLLSDLFPEEEVESAICALISAAVEEDQRKNEGKMCYQMVQTTLKKYGVNHQLQLNNSIVWLFMEVVENGPLDKSLLSKKKYLNLKRVLKSPKSNNFLQQLKMLVLVLNPESLQVTIPILCTSIIKNISGPSFTAQNENVRCIFDLVLSSCESNKGKKEKKEKKEKSEKGEERGKEIVEQRKERKEEGEEDEEFDEF